jgi:sialidase-1
MHADAFLDGPAQETTMRTLAVIPALLVLLTIPCAARAADGKPASPPASAPAPDQTDLFVAGRDGYHAFRIPALLVSAKGTLLAFCEGRRNSTSDAGAIDVVLKRSLDGGRTWQPMQTVAADGPNTVGNPCPVVDRDTGIIWLPLTWNLGSDTEAQIKKKTAKASREVWLTKSTDDGATWTKPINITSTTKDPDWTWYATGPGGGIQLKSGRLLIPCDHALAGSQLFRSHAIYSDDHGATWKLGGVIGDKVNECQAVELGDGRLMMNLRSYMGHRCRAVSWSSDGGLTWTPAQDEPALIEPVCQASILRFVLVFSNPASTKREKMTVRLSLDEGKTWSISALLSAGPSAYSSLAVLPDQRIGCLYERGEKSAYEKITLALFSLQWLTEPHSSVDAVP